MDIKKIVSEMTLEEKASLCSGSGFWHTKAVERLGVPQVMVSDGPHGLRKQDLASDHLGINDSIKAVCFPAGCATASSFDRDLVNTLGDALGNQCQAEDVSVVLGPAVNIKRSPLCGRNFEYFSEDPYLATEMATSYVKGVQSNHVGVSVKHYLANNQEHRRMTSDSQIDERTLREIYLAAFETVVKEAKPWTVMCSYNKVNGVYASENRRFLTEVLREEWGFDGYVVSDWGAVNDRVAGLKAGLELEMPSSNGVNDAKIVAAVKAGTLEESVLNTAVERILNIVDLYTNNRKADAIWDKDKDHELARKISAECMVLLKNENILPLAKEEKVAFIGEFASAPRYQGGGSSHINSTKVTSAVDAMAGNANVTFAVGYGTKQDVIDEALVKEAVEVAKAANVAVIFAGLPDSFESEGYDRSHMRMPECQNYLIQEVTKVQPNTVVVLHNGSPVEMPWINDVKAVLEVYLGGQAVGGATVDVLYGDANPSGRLAETFPIRLEDNPSYLYYVGEKDVVEYREGVFVGYRYYDKKKMDVLFPFGYGLSYTTFEYSDLTVDKKSFDDTDTVTVSVTVTNTGKVAGKEVVQLYVAPKTTEVIRPVRELKQFAKVELAPMERKTVTFTLSKRAFAYFNTEVNDWFVETGDYAIEIGKSSRDIVASEVVTVTGTTVIKPVYHLNSTMGDILADPKAKAVLTPYMEAMNHMLSPEQGSDVADSAITNEMQMAMINYMPVRGILNFANGMVTEEQMLALLDQINSL